MKKILAIVIAVLMLATSAMLETVPLSFSYQGRLTDAAGVPLTGNFDMTFRIFDNPVGGNLIWERMYQDVPVYIGAHELEHAVDLSILDEYVEPGLPKGLWLEMTVETDPPIMPRTQLLSSPFSMASYRLAGDIFTNPGHIAVFPGPIPVSDCAYVPLEIAVDSNSSRLRMKPRVTVGEFHYVGIDMETSFEGTRINLKPPVPVNDCTAYVPIQLYTNATESKISMQPSDSAIGSSMELSTGAAGSGPSLVMKNPSPSSKQAGEQMQIAMVQTNGMPVIEDPMLTLNATPSSGSSLVMLNPQPFPPAPAEPWLTLSTDLTTGPGMDMVDGIISPGPPQTTLHLTGGMAGSGSEVDLYGVVTPGPPQLQLKGGNPSEGASLVMRHNNAVGSTDDIVMTADANGGKIGINTPAPAEALHVVGNICATGSIGACSDARYKKDIETITNAQSIIEKIRGVYFNWRTSEFPNQDFSNKEQVGFIAQELKEVLPVLVSQGNDGYYSIDYAKLTPVLVEAMKEQQKTIESLSQRLEKLEKLVTPSEENKVEVAISH